MKKDIRSNVSGFTPVIDEILKDCGPLPALIFGRIWRFCQMEDGVCTASQQTIANDTGVSVSTVKRCADALIENGYLEKTVVDGIGVTYIDTGKAGLTNEITAVKQTPLRKSDPPSSERARDVAQKELQRKNIVKKEYTTDKKNSLYEIAQVLANVCVMDFELNKGRLFKEAKVLAKDSRITAELIMSAYKPGGIWYKDDWRGQKGQPPRPEQIKETFTNLLKLDKKPIEVDARSR